MKTKQSKIDFENLTKMLQTIASDLASQNKLLVFRTGSAARDIFI